VDGTDCRSRPTAGFGISGTETSVSANTVLVRHLTAVSRTITASLQHDRAFFMLLGTSLEVCVTRFY
jgi:hypothetical protein